MSNDGGSAKSPVGFFSILFFVFLILKLCGVINWSWWWVTAPLWGPLVALVPFLIFCVIMWAIFNRH